jgi:hypothetical protein
MTAKLHDLNIWGVSKPKGPNRIAKIDKVTYAQLPGRCYVMIPKRRVDFIS